MSRRVRGTATPKEEWKRGEEFNQRSEEARFRLPVTCPATPALPQKRHRAFVQIQRHAPIVRDIGGGARAQENLDGLLRMHRGTARQGETHAVHHPLPAPRPAARAMVCALLLTFLRAFVLPKNTTMTSITTTTPVYAYFFFFPLGLRATRNTSVLLLFRVRLPFVCTPHGVHDGRPPEVRPSPPPMG